MNADENINEPTILSREDIDNFAKRLANGEFDPKMVKCRKCSLEHFPSYGYPTGECDECFFSRFPKEQVREFYRSFF